MILQERGRTHPGAVLRSKEGDMMNRIAGALALMSVLTAFGIYAAPAAPATDPSHKTVDGIEIYLGFLPAESVRDEYPNGSPESSRHRGIPKRAGYYHVNVSLFNSKTQPPISDAQVAARVEEIGNASESKKLELMKTSNVVSYGNYFKMSGKGPYWIKLQIQIPGVAKTIKTQFEHRHY